MRELFITLLIMTGVFFVVVGLFYSITEDSVGILLGTFLIGGLLYLAIKGLDY